MLAEQQGCRGIEPADTVGEHPRAEIAHPLGLDPSAQVVRPRPAPTAAVRRSHGRPSARSRRARHRSQYTSKPRSVIGSCAVSPALKPCSCGGNENRRSTDRFTSPTISPPDSKPSASGSVDQIQRRQRPHVEVAPPGGLVLPAVPLQQVGEQRNRRLLGASATTAAQVPTTAGRSAAARPPNPRRSGSVSATTGRGSSARSRPSRAASSGRRASSQSRRASVARQSSSL